MRSVGMPVVRAAAALAASISSRGSMQVSTTQIATRSWPLPITNARAISRSCARVAVFSRKPPFTRTGKAVGVMSTAAAPAR